ncbi:MAG: SDR family oxidoreductase [Bacteroidota bacterium]
MQDKTVLITGGNEGIGLATAIRLAEKGAQIILSCRDEHKGLNAAGVISKKTGNEKTLVIPFDLADLGSVSAAAEFILTEHPKLDVLINNAGVFTNRLHHTQEGYELQFGVNHLGHFLLTNLLLPALQFPDEGGRVINVSSSAHFRGEIDFTNLRGEKGDRQYNGPRAYAKSKLANVLFTKELARRYQGEITANCLHPGVVATRFANKNGGAFVSTIWNLYKPFARKPDKGADTVVYLAKSPEVRDVTGRYFDQRQCVKRPSESARDKGLAERLWQYSQTAVAKYINGTQQLGSNQGPI